MFCQFCGSQLSNTATFCPQCGRSQQPGGAPAPTPAPVAYTPPAGAKAQIGSWISQGWAIVKADIGVFMLIGLLFLIINGLVPIILQGPLTAGFQIAAMKRLMKGRVEFGDLFKGFNFFVPTLVAYLIIAVFVAFGTLLCIIPGLVLAAMYQFAYLFIVDKKMDFWPAMQASAAIVKQDYFGFTLFLVCLGLINLLGLLACLVGVLVTIPIHFAAVTIAYKELVGFEQATVDMA